MNKLNELVRVPRYYELITAILLILILSSCAKLIPYPNQSIENRLKAQSIIEQAIMEQPEKFKPAAVYFNDDYISLSYGLATTASGRGYSSATPILNSTTVIAGGSSSSSSLTYEKHKRIYYTSISKVELYKKNSYFIINIINTSNRALYKIYIYNKTQAFDVANALNFLALKSSSEK
ncbi:hypothetical protein [Cysteiniphilum halobium]|uniref:hypothetical protein n=1 Tax=Cysteiniphilum halobium TaxID=2219059 RepID=UPI000E64D325|nr:hypothetical protein [Cysteiniphilum halobium]